MASTLLGGDDGDAHAALNSTAARLKREHGVDVMANSVGGVRDAVTKRRPDVLRPGCVFVFGREVSATEVTPDAQAAGELMRLMESEPYQNRAHPMHEAAQLAVEKAFAHLHPPEEE